MISPLSAGHAYDLARNAIAPGRAAATDHLVKRDAANPSLLTSGDRFVAALEEIDTTAKSAMTGEVGPQTLVQTIAEAEIALETVVAIRDRVVEAYQEILRMPV